MIEERCLCVCVCVCVCVLFTERKRMKEKFKEIQVLKEERHFFFLSHKRPWTQGSPEDTLPRHTRSELRTTTANRFTKQQIRKSVGTRTRSKVAKKTCPQLLQWKGRLLGLRTFFTLNPSETLTQRGARASQI